MTNPMREALEAAKAYMIETGAKQYLIDGVNAALSAVPAPVSEEEIGADVREHCVGLIVKHCTGCADAHAIKAASEITRYLADPSRTEGEWRPIETAPKDEYAPTLVLDGGEAYMAELVNAKAQIWTQLGTGCDCEHPRRLYPTHWMPLPSPPSELSGTITSGEVQSNAEAVVPEWRPDPKTVEAQRDFVEWVDTWVSNPVTGYSVYALDGLFGMARDKIAAIRSLSNQTSAEKE